MNRRQMKKKLKASSEKVIIPETEENQRERLRKTLLKDGIDLDWLELSVEIEKIPSYLEPVTSYFERKEM